MDNKLEIKINIPESIEARKSFDRLVDSAEKLFSEKGYKNTTIKEIAVNANLSVGGFYVYFESKYQIYVYIMNRFADGLKKHLEGEALKDYDGNRIELQVKFIMALIKYVYKNPACYNLIFESLYIDRDLFFQYYYNYAVTYVPGLVSSGVLPDDIDPMSWAFINMGIGNFLGFKVLAEKDVSDEQIGKIEKTVRKLVKSGLMK